MLREQVARGNTARVIVQLGVPVQPEGILAGTAEVESQRATVGTTQSALVSALPAHGWRTTAQFKTIPFIGLEVDSGTLRALEGSDLVVGIEEDRLASPLLFDSDRVVEADQSWAAGFDGTGQTVAILDTGVDGNHPFLAGKIVSEMKRLM